MLIGFDEAFPLWMLSTPDVGGLGWNTKQIGEVTIASGRAPCQDIFCIVCK